MTIIKNNEEKPIDEYIENGSLKKTVINDDIIVFNCALCGKKENKRVEVIRKKKMDIMSLLCSRCNNKKTLMEKYGVKNQFQRKEIKEKIIETNLEKYGVDNPAKSSIIQEQTKKTLMEKYGVENIFQDTNRIKESMLEKYGVDNPAKVKEIAEKIGLTQRNKTNEEKEEINERRRKKHLNKTNEEKKQIIEKIKNTNLIKYGVSHYTKTKEYKEKNKILRKKMSYERMKKVFSTIEILTPFENYKNFNILKDAVCVKCKICGKEFNFVNRSGYKRNHRCPVCFPFPIGGSWEEDEFANFISSIYNGTIERNNRTILNGQEIDIYIPEFNLGFEYNGLFWHSELSGNRDKNYHVNKQKLAQEKGINLFFINSNIWAEKKEIVKSIIKAKLGIFDKKIFARKCSIHYVDNKEAQIFLEENHIQGNVIAKVKIGLYYNNELVALCTFGKNRFGGNYEWELYRFCSKKGYQIIGGFSKIISFFEKNENPKSIGTFSDKTLFYQETYENNGFVFIGDTSPNYYYTNDYLLLETRIKYQKHKLSSLLENFDPTLTEWENMINNGYDRIWDCGNRVFVKEVINV